MVKNLKFAKFKKGVSAQALLQLEGFAIMTFTRRPKAATQRRRDLATVTSATQACVADANQGAASPESAPTDGILPAPIPPQPNANPLPGPRPAADPPEEKDTTALREVTRCQKKHSFFCPVLKNAKLQELTKRMKHVMHNT